MTHRPDPLDVLLDGSAPAGAPDDPALRRDLGVMASEARTASRSRRRPVRLVATAGLAALLVSGAGAAVAGSVFDWEPWAQDPDLAYPFVLPSGRACEARVSVYDVVSIDENGSVQRDPADDSDFARHLRGVDVVGEADVRAEVAEVRLRDTRVSYVAVTPDGHLEDVPATASGPTEDDVHAAAVSAAVRDALGEEAAAFGRGDRWTTDEAVLCEAVAP